MRLRVLCIVQQILIRRIPGHRINVKALEHIVVISLAIVRDVLTEQSVLTGGRFVRDERSRVLVEPPYCVLAVAEYQRDLTVAHFHRDII